MLLLLAALPALFWDGPADTAAALRDAGIKHIQVPAARLADVLEALRAALAKVVVGDPRLEQVRMGPVASLSQRREVSEQLAKLRSEAEVVYGEAGKLQPEVEPQLAHL